MKYLPSLPPYLSCAFSLLRKCAILNLSSLVSGLWFLISHCRRHCHCHRPPIAFHHLSPLACRVSRLRRSHHSPLPSPSPVPSHMPALSLPSMPCLSCLRGPFTRAIPHSLVYAATPSHSSTLTSVPRALSPSRHRPFPSFS